MASIQELWGIVLSRPYGLYRGCALQMVVLVMIVSFAFILPCMCIYYYLSNTQTKIMLKFDDKSF